MKSLLFKLSFILFCVTTSAQNLKKSDFRNTEWFADNENEKFYKADTIKLLKIRKLNDEIEELNRLYFKVGKNCSKDITGLKFKNKKVFVDDLIVESWNVHHLDGTWKYSFDVDNQNLNLYFNNELRHSFNVIRQESEYLTLRKNKKGRTKDFEMEFINVMLIRIKK